MFTVAFPIIGNLPNTIGKFTSVEKIPESILAHLQENDPLLVMVFKKLFEHHAAIVLMCGRSHDDVLDFLRTIRYSGRIDRVVDVGNAVHAANIANMIALYSKLDCVAIVSGNDHHNKFGITTGFNHAAGYFPNMVEVYGFDVLNGVKTTSLFPIELLVVICQAKCHWEDEGRTAAGLVRGLCSDDETIMSISYIHPMICKPSLDGNPLLLTMRQMDDVCMNDVNPIRYGESFKTISVIIWGDRRMDSSELIALPEYV